jgi:hypothetical protein
MGVKFVILAAGFPTGGTFCLGIMVMSLEDYQSIEETAYLLRSPKNAKRLLESIVQLDKGIEKELIE